ncbi:hypothetical protein [Azospirillum argentinense]
MLHDPGTAAPSVGAGQHGTAAQPIAAHAPPGLPSMEAMVEAARDTLYQDHYAHADYHSSFNSWKEAARTHRSTLIPVIQNTYQLYIHMQADLGRAREELRRECEHHVPKIPVQSNSNDLLLLVKLTFDDAPKRASKIASALLFALVRKTPPYDLPDFLKVHGGIEGCANALARFKREQNASLSSSDQIGLVKEGKRLPKPKAEWSDEVRQQLADLRGSGDDSVNCTLKAVINTNGVIKIMGVDER